MALAEGLQRWLRSLPEGGVSEIAVDLPYGSQWVCKPKRAMGAVERAALVHHLVGLAGSMPGKLVLHARGCAGEEIACLEVVRDAV